MSIDWWTLGIQAVNVAILVWLLGRFFWRPVAAMIEQRRATVLQALADAEAKQAEAAAALAEIERTRAGFAEEREAILAAARDAAERARTARLEEVAAEAASLETAARAVIGKERAAVDQAWAERAGHLAVAIAERLVGRLDGPAVRETFLDGLLAEVRRLPDSARRAASASGGALEVVSASAIALSDQARCRERIGEALGSRPEISFKVDPALIGGLELHGPHFAINNSWRADLTRIQADLSHDSRS